MPRPRARAALAILFGIASLNALAQVAIVPMGLSNDPAVLMLLQALVGVASALAAFGCWRGKGWAPGAVLAWGFVTAVMLVALVPVLDLEPEARPGLWSAAAVVLLIAAVSARYLRRTVPSSRRL